MTTPVRIQRRRTAGWRAPAGARYVGRGSRYGNPWVVVQTPSGWAVNWVPGGPGPKPAAPDRWTDHDTRHAAHERAVYRYAEMLADNTALLATVREELAGRSLMCWCPRALPCHADVLLAAAAGEDPRPARAVNAPTHTT